MKNICNKGSFTLVGRFRSELGLLELAGSLGNSFLKKVILDGQFVGHLVEYGCQLRELIFYTVAALSHTTRYLEWSL